MKTAFEAKQETLKADIEKAIEYYPKLKQVLDEIDTVCTNGGENVYIDYLRYDSDEANYLRRLGYDVGRYGRYGIWVEWMEVN